MIWEIFFTSWLSKGQCVSLKNYLLKLHTVILIDMQKAKYKVIQTRPRQTDIQGHRGEELFKNKF